MVNHYVFVYGTLKRGYWNNQLLEDQKYLGEAVTIDSFAMFDGGFPVLVPNSRGIHSDYKASIRGELYEVDDYGLSMCDQLEGHPEFYERYKLPIELLTSTAPPKREVAWVYIGKSACEGREVLVEPKLVLETYFQIEWEG